MEPEVATREDAPVNALHRYADAYDLHAAEEQRLVGLGQYDEAQGAHTYALWCLRAYNAELGDFRAKGVLR